MDLKYVFSIIMEMEDEWYKPPERYYGRKKISFEEQSYKHSAIEEIKIYLLSHINDDPIECLEGFCHDVDTFAACSKNATANFMFSIYHDVAVDLLDVLVSMGLERG